MRNREKTIGKGMSLGTVIGLAIGALIGGLTGDWALSARKCAIPV